MKVKNLRKMYEKCIREMEEFDQEAHIQIMLEYESENLDTENMCVYDLDKAEILVGDDVCTVAENYETIDAEVVLLVKAKKNGEVAQMLERQAKEDYFENLLEDYDFHYAFLPKTTTRDTLEEFIRNYRLPTPELKSIVTRMKWTEMLHRHKKKVESIMQNDLMRLLTSYKKNEAKMERVLIDDVIKTFNIPTAVEYFAQSHVAIIVYMFDDHAVIVRKNLYIDETPPLCAKIPVPTREEAGIDVDENKKMLDEMSQELSSFEKTIQEKQEETLKYPVSANFIELSEAMKDLDFSHFSDAVESLMKIINKKTGKEQGKKKE